MSNNEITEILMERPGIKIERIISRGYVSPEGTWYDQSEDEWVVLIKGKAVLGYYDGSETVLDAGDIIFIPAGRKHRIKSTSADPACEWFCVFIDPETENK